MCFNCDDLLDSGMGRPAFNSRNKPSQARPLWCKMPNYPLLKTLTRLRNVFVANGLDLFAPFNVKQYNDAVDQKYHLPAFARKNE